MPEVHRAIPLDDDRTVSVDLGSIVEEEVDAIVNAANSRLSHGGGVAAVISGAAGSALDDESRAHVRENGPVEVGDAAVTTAGDLPHQGVIHAVGPRQGEGSEEEKLTSAVAVALVETASVLVEGTHARFRQERDPRLHLIGPAETRRFRGAGEPPEALGRRGCPPRVRLRCPAPRRGRETAGWPLWGASPQRVPHLS